MTARKPQTPTARTCGGCKLHDPATACCELFGSNRKRRDKACSEWSDGKVTKARRNR